MVKPVLPIVEIDSNHVSCNSVSKLTTAVLPLQDVSSN
jgi:hypothetical protein